MIRVLSELIFIGFSIKGLNLKSYINLQKNVRLLITKVIMQASTRYVKKEIQGKKGEKA